MIAHELGKSLGSTSQAASNHRGRDIVGKRIGNLRSCEFGTWISGPNAGCRARNVSKEAVNYETAFMQDPCRNVPLARFPVF